MALGGIAMLFKGSDGATLSIAGTVLVMASSLTYAGYIVAQGEKRVKPVCGGCNSADYIAFQRTHIFFEKTSQR